MDARDELRRDPLTGASMLDRSLKTEFDPYRNELSSDEARRAFDERIERLLSARGVDYVRGYVDALKEASVRPTGTPWGAPDRH
jgi:hypothetical protein